LEKVGESMWQATESSGAARNEATAAGITRSKINQGYLEASNVNVADEMVNLIVAQRAYELNSRAITTSDTMLEQANNLRR
jgi:flagellar basal-body rod protein FlgG